MNKLKNTISTASLLIFVNTLTFILVAFVKLQDKVKTMYILSPFMAAVVIVIFLSTYVQGKLEVLENELTVDNLD
jgi:amino acid permease